MTRRIVLPLLMSVLMAAGLFAQVNTATVLGTVTDASGAVVPGALMTITNVNTRVEKTATTNEAGTYALERLPVGVYVLVVKAAGFKQAERPNIELDATERVKIDVALEIGMVTDSVTVSSGAPLVATQNTELVEFARS